MPIKATDLLHRGWQTFRGPLGPIWFAGLGLGLLVSLSGLLIGGWPTLLGLLLLSGWLPLLAELSGGTRWSWRQRGQCWGWLLGLAILWLPLGWGGYLSTLQAGLTLPVEWQNWLFMHRYDWLPAVGVLWGGAWLISWKWLPAVRRQLQRPGSLRTFLITGWQTPWRTVAWQGLRGCRYLLAWLGLAVSWAALTWLAELWTPVAGRVTATLGLVSLRAVVWLVVAGWWSTWWPAVPVQRHSWWHLVAGLVIASAWLGTSWWLNGPQTRTPAVIAHRGVDGRDGVQNTTTALTRTVRRSQPARVEMDIQPTADRQWVVMHDPTLNQLSAWSGPVEHYRLSQLSGLPLTEAGQRGRLSSFDDYLRVADQRRQPLLVEIKAVGAAPALVGPFVAQYGARLLTDHATLHSLDYQIVAGLKRRQPQLTVGYVTPFYLTAFANDTAADFYSLQALTVTAAQVRSAHRQGRRVYVWTVDRPFQMHRMRALGVDGIITNHPSRLRPILRHSEHYNFYQFINWTVSWL
ncbi:glycerophosphodiester phosphodiesterase [Lactiplantibacillus modestisalitolerans]|uniref:Glycerophosphodiester phosphodiesterase family protein n=1 Tax=Lactiplantibacillus modestisalitolerans TaxID=1457219 RepID=A0ABV5WVQ3_9LACO|nr:glycerophosphodiester phosphodiesterase [Lactiplantibacillus modestisalitolerans]